MAAHFLFKMSTARILVIAVFITAAKVILGEETCEKPHCDFRQLDGETDFKVNSSQPAKLVIFCYRGLAKSWWNLWVNPHLRVTVNNESTTPPDLAVHYGNNLSDCKQQTSGLKFFNWNTFLPLKDVHKLSPFNNSCISFTSNESYEVHFRIKNPELWYIAYLILGVILFFCASSWSRNSFFHYSTGVSLGVLASFLIIIFIMNRMLPQRLKTISYIVMMVSGSASLFMMQVVKNYLSEIIQNHWHLLLGYVGISALLSFIVIYRMGPITETRSLNLVRWSLQALGLFLVYQGTQIAEASAAIILVILMVYLYPRTAPGWVKSIWYKLFPPKIHLLTEEEYNREGEEETRKALEDLRQYCHSPLCNPWDTVSHLSSPSRFANFVAGEPHVTDAEIEDHSMFVQSVDFSDIDDEESGGGESVNARNPRSFHSQHNQHLSESAELTDSDSDYDSEPNNRYFHSSQPWGYNML